MDQRWTSNLGTQDEKERFRKYVRQSKGVLDRLDQLLAIEEDILTSKETNESAYDTPSWAPQQADRNGYRRCLRRIRQLIYLDQRNDNEPV